MIKKRRRDARARKVTATGEAGRYVYTTGGNGGGLSCSFPPPRSLPSLPTGASVKAGFRRWPSRDGGVSVLLRKQREKRRRKRYDRNEGGIVLRSREYRCTVIIAASIIPRIKKDRAPRRAAPAAICNVSVGLINIEVHLSRLV